MNSSCYRFSLDMHSTQSQVSIPVMQGDTARTLYISLTDGSKPYVIADGSSAMISIKRPTGTQLNEFCVIENNAVIRYEFSQNENTAAVLGLHNCTVSLYDANSSLITSPRFAMVVSDRVVNSDDIILTDEDRTAVDALLAKEAERQSNESARATAELERKMAEVERTSSFEAALDTLKAKTEKVVPTTHRWYGTVLIVTSSSGSSSADLKGEKGDKFTYADFTEEQLNELKNDIAQDVLATFPAAEGRSY